MRKAYAADFGAGNTCLYCAKPNAKIKEATPLNTPGGEPSGYALDKRNTVKLGLGLYGLKFHNLEQIERFRINLKAQPTEADVDELVYYFGSWLEKMKTDHPEEFKDVDKEYWFIGCPTGGEWKQKDVQNLYKTIFEKAGFQNVHIVPESNAALAFYQQKDRILDDFGKDTRLLLIDQGAYSLDATNYSGGKVTSYGGYLGASLIERMMVHEILYTDEQNIRLKKRMINWPQTVEKARSIYEQEGINGKFYTYLLLQARKLKEDYFSALNNNSLIDTSDLIRTLDFSVDDEELVLFTNSVMMEKILERTPVKKILGDEFETLAPEVRSEIGNKTWMQAFRDFLDRVDEEYPDLKTGADIIIMVTGGGSMMSHVAEAIKAHYKGAVVHCDMEAVAAIGKGMAYWAPDKIAALDFHEVFDKFANREEVDEDGDRVNCISQRLSKAFFECIIQLVKDIIAEESKAVVYGITQWRDYNCTGSEIPKKIQWHLKDWCKNTGMSSFLSDIDGHVSGLKVKLNSEFNETASSFGEEEFELLRKDDEVFLSECKKALPMFFDIIVEQIANHYTELDVWSSFPNTNKKLFSNPRSDFYNTIMETLNEWMQKETDSTIQLCQKVFYEFEFEITDSVKYTFSQLFQIEGRLDLLNLMKKHVKEILGKLVLEEYIETEEDESE